MAGVPYSESRGKQVRMQRRAQGLCRCGRVARANLRICEKCSKVRTSRLSPNRTRAAEGAAYARELRERKRLAGECVKCKLPADDGHSYCIRHLDNAKARNRRRRLRLLNNPQTADIVHKAQREACRKYRTRRLGLGLCDHGGCSERPLLSFRTCWRHKHLDALRQIAYTDRLKEKILAHYGRECACSGCSEKEAVFLTIDHVRGDGYLDRDGAGRKTGNVLYRAIIAAGYPDHFQVLCYNCNCAKRSRPHCPHEELARNKVA